MKKILFALSFILMSSCIKEDLPKDYTEENEQEIITYLEKHNLTATKDEYGIYYVIEEEGTGEAPISTDIVKAKLTASLTNGDVFIDNKDKGVQLILQRVLYGLAYGVQKFKIGGSGKIIIPSRLAYGNSERVNIPGGSVVIFDIELLDIYANINIANNAEIIEYLAEEGIENAIQTDTGLYYVIEEEGTGEHPTSTDNVTVVYKGYLTNGVVFDQSNEVGYTDTLTNLIQGWQEGIPYFKEGGSGKLFIPSRLGYGNEDRVNIPGGSVLIFDIELSSINK